MKWLRNAIRDHKRGYTDAQIERVREWVVERKNVTGDVVYLNTVEMRIFDEFAPQWGVIDANVRYLP